MRVVITGASGLLGRALMLTKPECHSIIPFTRSVPFPSCKVDLSDPASISNNLKLLSPDIVIHCASQASVDKAQDDFSRSLDVSIDSVGYLLEALRTCNVKKIIYISSNAVFDGRNSPYSELDERNPINMYGQMKCKAEDRITKTFNWTIVRPIFLYGWNYSTGRDNWATTIIRKGLLHKKGETQNVRMVTDTVTQPTYANDCAKVIWRCVLDCLDNEILHVAGKEKCNLYEFAIKVAEAFDLPTDFIKKARSSDFPNIAPRPKDTTYNLEKLSRLCINEKIDFPNNIVNGLKQMRKDVKLCTQYRHVFS